MIDLHTHSNASDGDYSPEMLLREAEKRGISAIALTDHDTLDGLESAEKEAKAAGIRFIRGIEININRSEENLPGVAGPGGEFHLLGLGIKSPTPDFLEAVSELARRREARNREMFNRMRETGIEAEWEEVLALSGGRTVGRPHFAGLLVLKKIVKNREQAFARYLGAGKPLYVPKAGLDFAEAAALIRKSGGIPVLAHPGSLYVAWGRLPLLIKLLKDRGLAGIEAWHPNTGAGFCRRLEKLGKSLGLYITEGSDFHGLTRPGRELGCSHKGRKIDDSVLDAIPELN